MFKTLSFDETIKRAHYHHAEKRQLVKIIQTLINSGSKTLLDVGCGDGAFLKLFSKLGVSVSGVDVNQASVEEIRKAGFHCMTVEEWKPLEQQYDLLFLSHVIEHVKTEELLDLLDSYLDRLKQSGYMIIVTPLLSERFYYDFTHVRPYYPQSIWHAFGDNTEPIAKKARNRVRLKDVYFIRDSYRLRKCRSYYVRDNQLKNFLVDSCNYLLAAAYLATRGRVGVMASWIGIYKKESIGG